MPSVLANINQRQIAQLENHTRLVKKITKPLAKAVRFIGKKLHLAQPKSSQSFVQPKKTQLSKAAKNLLNQANSTSFHALRSQNPQVKARTNTVTASDSSVFSGRTQQVNNKSKGAAHLRDLALNSYETSQAKPRGTVFEQKQLLANRDFVLAAKEGYTGAVNNLIAVGEINFSKAAGSALEQAVIHGHNQVFDTIFCEPQAATIENLHLIAELIIKHQRVDMLETLANRGFGADALVKALYKTLTRKGSAQNTSQLDKPIEFAQQIISSDLTRSNTITSNLINHAVFHGDPNLLDTFFEAMPSNVTLGVAASDGLLLRAVQNNQIGAVKTLLEQNILKIDKQLAQQSLIKASNENNAEMIDVLLANEKLLKACYSQDFIKQTIIEGRENLCGRLIECTRPFNLRNDFGFVMYCMKYAELAIQEGKNNLLPVILKATGYSSKKHNQLASRLSWLFPQSPEVVSKLFKVLLKDNTFDPSVSGNYALHNALRENQQNVVATLLTDIRSFNSLYGHKVLEISSFLKDAIENLDWKPKFSFKELISTVNKLIEENDWDREFSGVLLPLIITSLEKRHDKAIVEAEKFSKVLFAKGFDANFVQDKMTHIFGGDLFALQSDREHTNSILNLVRKWEQEKL